MAEVEEIAHAIAGAGGGALSMIVTYPLVTLSTLAQTTTKKKKQQEKNDESTNSTNSNSKNSNSPVEVKEWHRRVVDKIIKSSTYQAAHVIIKEKGFLGLYAGLESALYGITLTNFIYYYFYELTSNVFLRANAAAAAAAAARRTPGGSTRVSGGLSTAQSIVTGAIAGAITCVGSNPFWVANTRMMTAKKLANSPDGAGPGARPPPTNSTFKQIVEIIETDGVGTLFAGVLPALVLVINPIIQYTIFEQIKNVVVAKNGKQSFTAIKAFFIGALGKLIATSLTYPYITLKSRMHIKKKMSEGDNVVGTGTSSGTGSGGNAAATATAATASADKNLSMIQEIRKIIREEGLEGLYGGLTVKLIQSISTAAFLFYFKEELLTGSVKLVQIFKLLKIKQSSTKTLVSSA